MSDGGMYLGVASQSNKLLREFQKFKELIRRPTIVEKSWPHLHQME